MERERQALEVLTEVGRLDPAARAEFLATQVGADSELAAGLRRLAALVERADAGELTRLGKLAMAGRGGVAEGAAAGGHDETRAGSRRAVDERDAGDERDDEHARDAADESDAGDERHAAGERGAGHERDVGDAAAQTEPAAATGDASADASAELLLSAITGASPWLSEVMREAFDDRAPPLLPADRPLDVGDTVGKYRLEHQLGEGGMGQVFVARDEKLGRSVALKTIRGDLALSEAARDRFHREARILSHLEHPRICRLYDAFAIEGTDVLVLERIEGRTLTDVMADGRLSLDRALEIAEQITEALVAAHATGIVHRDLKPANVMVRADGSVKVLDFGIARRVDEVSADEPVSPARAAALTELDTDEALTEQGAILGTLLFMSPEQARGESVGATADLFALGLLLVELVTGAAARPPASSRKEALEAAQAGTTVSLDALPGGVARIAASLIAVDPAARGDALTVLTQLRDLRAAPARRRRRTIIGVVLAAFLVFAVKYVVDLDEQKVAAEAARDLADDRRVEAERARELEAEQRAAADAARNEAELARGLEAQQRAAAETARGKAEGLLGYMVDDLYDKLGDLGKLDLLEDVADRARDYFEATPAGEMSVVELNARSHQLYKLGDVRFQANELDDARALFSESRDIARSLHELDPLDGAALFSLGQAEYYVGYVSFNQGDYDAAEEPWRAYLDVSRQLVQLDPSRVDWQIELTYAETNLGALHQKRGDAQAALQSFGEVTAVWEHLVAAHPDAIDYRMELADALSWLASAQRDVPDLEAALATREREVSLREGLLEDPRAPVVWQQQLIESEHHLGVLLEARGEFERALVLFDRSAQRARELGEHDPRNARWQREIAIALLRGAEVAYRSSLPLGAVSSRLDEVAAHLDPLRRADPRNTDLLLLEASRLIVLGNARAAAGEPWSDAFDGAWGVTTELLREAPDVRMTHVLVAAIWQGRALAFEGEDRSVEAHAAWTEVVELSADADESEPRMLSKRRQALSKLGRIEEAAEVASRLHAIGHHVP